MTLWQDVRFALRGMLKSRAVTAVALFTLAVGIGANTAIFSIVNAVLLRPLPFHDPGQLVEIYADLPGVGAKGISFSEPEYEDLRDRAGIFDAVSVVWPAPANLTGGERPERIEFLGVSPDYFGLLGARPQLGRLFDKRDTADGFADAVVISDGLWRRVFGGDPPSSATKFGPITTFTPSSASCRLNFVIPRRLQPSQSIFGERPAIAPRPLWRTRLTARAGCRRSWDASSRVFLWKKPRLGLPLWPGRYVKIMPRIIRPTGAGRSGPRRSKRSSSEIHRRCCWFFFWL